MTRVLAKQYTVAQTDEGAVFLLTAATEKMLRFVRDHSEATYQELANAIDVPVATLITYASRLSEAGLLTRKKRLLDKRTYTVLCLKQPINLDFDVQRI